MCLRVEKDALKRIAQEDIPCFKVLRKNTYISPYASESYVFGERKYAEIGKLLDFGYSRRLTILTGDLSNYMAIEQGLHTYVTREDANVYESEESIFVLCDAIIPKGAEYYEGKFFIDGKAYVSNRLIVNKPSK